MKRPVESDYTSHVAYTRALEGYCDALEQQYMTNAAGELEPVTVVKTGVGIGKPEQKPAGWIDYIVKEAHEKYDLATSRAAFQAGAIFVQRILNTSPEFMDCVITKRTNK